MSGTLVILRHGQSEWNLANLFTGWHDVALTELGAAEAAAAGVTMRDAGLRVRHVAHVAADAGGRHPEPRARGDGPVVAARRAELAPQRTALRIAPGPRQEGDHAPPRRRTGPRVAAQLRRATASRRPRQPRAPGERPPLPAPSARRAAGERVPEGRRRPRPALLVRPDRATAARRS